MCFSHKTALNEIISFHWYEVNRETFNALFVKPPVSGSSRLQQKLAW